MTGTVIAEVISGAAMAAGGWMFAEIGQLHKIVRHLTPKKKK